LRAYTKIHISHAPPTHPATLSSKIAVIEITIPAAFERYTLFPDIAEYIRPLINVFADR
jgi:hypothetical protein